MCRLPFTTNIKNMLRNEISQALKSAMKAKKPEPPEPAMKAKKAMKAKREQEIYDITSLEDWRWAVNFTKAEQGPTGNAKKGSELYKKAWATFRQVNRRRLPAGTFETE